jgi:hypothetical protein
MARGFIKRAAVTIGTIVSWVYTILDILFDWIGRSTVDDDWKQLLNEKLPAWADWLFSTPSWMPGVCAILLTLWLIWLSRSPTERAPANADTDPSRSTKSTPNVSDPARDERLRMRKENQRLAREVERLRLQQPTASVAQTPPSIEGSEQSRLRAVDLESADTKRAKHRLVVFAAEMILPACERQLAL